MSLLELAAEAIDELFAAISRDREQYIRECWWRFVDRRRREVSNRSIAVRQGPIWPLFWGHRVPLGGDSQ